MVLIFADSLPVTFVLSEVSINQSIKLWSFVIEVLFSKLGLFNFETYEARCDRPKASIILRWLWWQDSGMTLASIRSQSASVSDIMTRSSCWNTCRLASRLRSISLKKLPMSKSIDFTRRSVISFNYHTIQTTVTCPAIINYLTINFLLKFLVNMS